MNRSIVATLIGCLCLSAQAANVSVPVSVTATNTTKSTASVSTGAIETNFVELVGMFITVPAYVKADIELATLVDGVKCVLDTQTVKGGTNGASVVYRTPKSLVFKDNFNLIGTNTLLSVQQYAFGTNSFEVVARPGTNTWAVQLLIKQ